MKQSLSKEPSGRSLHAMPTYRAELHVHTVLSPCAGVEMIPPVIVDSALVKGINLIAITDHNATANIGAVMEAAVGTGLTVLPGMELQTREEVHVLCLFDGLEQAKTWQRSVDSRFGEMPNDIEHFGEQFIVDETGDFIRRESRLLISNVNMSLVEAVEEVNALGGLVIPAHVERRAYGLMAVLGFAPPIFEAMEISKHVSVEDAHDRFPELQAFPLLQSGDVHFPDGFIGVMEFEMYAPTISEIRKAIHGEGGNSMRIISPP